MSWCSVDSFRRFLPCCCGILLGVKAASRGLMDPDVVIEEASRVTAWTEEPTASWRNGSNKTSDSAPVRLVGDANRWPSLRLPMFGVS